MGRTIKGDARQDLLRWDYSVEQNSIFLCCSWRVASPVYCIHVRLQCHPSVVSLASLISVCGIGLSDSNKPL